MYDKFSSLMDKIVALLVMTDYYLVCVKLQNKNVHYLRFSKNQSRAFTIIMNSIVDKYYAMFSIAISYHFHDDKVMMEKYKGLFKQTFEDFGSDNAVYFENEEDILNGLEKFLKII